jgi:hypothetical protein
MNFKIEVLLYFLATQSALSSAEEAEKNYKFICGLCAFSVFFASLALAVLS